MASVGYHQLKQFRVSRAKCWKPRFSSALRTSAAEQSIMCSRFVPKHRRECLTMVSCWYPVVLRKKQAGKVDLGLSCWRPPRSSFRKATANHRHTSCTTSSLSTYRSYSVLAHPRLSLASRESVAHSLHHLGCGRSCLRERWTYFRRLVTALEVRGGARGIDVSHLDGLSWVHSSTRRMIGIIIENGGISILQTA
jgi:hypothetical protein